MIHSICAVKFFPCDWLAEPRVIERTPDKTYETTTQRDSS